MMVYMAVTWWTVRSFTDPIAKSFHIDYFFSFAGIGIATSSFALVFFSWLELSQSLREKPAVANDNPTAT